MTEIVDAYSAGMPSWPKDAKPRGLIAVHDTEGGTGRIGAMNTRQFLLDTAATRNASYHEMWAWDGSTGLTVIRIVPPNRVSGGINPNPPDYNPDAWVRAALGINWWDPNQVVYAVSIAGSKAYASGLAAVPAFVKAAKQRLQDLAIQLHVWKVAEHFRFQPVTRSDWGTVLTPALGGLTIPKPNPVIRYEATVGPGLVTGFHIPHGTTIPDSQKTGNFTRPSGAGKVTQGIKGYWYVLATNSSGYFRDYYLIAGKSGRFTVDAVHMDGSRTRVY